MVKKFNEQYKAINENYFGNDINSNNIIMTKQGILKSNIMIVIIKKLKRKYSLNDTNFSVNGTTLEIENDLFNIQFELNGNSIKIRDAENRPTENITLKNIDEYIDGTLLNKMDEKIKELI